MKKIIFGTLFVVMLVTSCESYIPLNETQTITPSEVLIAQKEWGNSIVAIGKAFTQKKDYKTLANQMLDELYAYNETNVLFKPTLASEKPFRLQKKEALSYLISGLLQEDNGFALQTWSKVSFENHGLIINGNQAIAMGHYYFTHQKTQTVTMVEYTFGYYKNKTGKILINLHHSSIPFKT